MITGVLLITTYLNNKIWELNWKTENKSVNLFNLSKMFSNFDHELYPHVSCLFLLARHWLEVAQSGSKFHSAEYLRTGLIAHAPHKARTSRLCHTGARDTCSVIGQWASRDGIETHCNGIWDYGHLRKNGYDLRLDGVAICEKPLVWTKCDDVRTLGEAYDVQQWNEKNLLW